MTIKRDGPYLNVTWLAEYMTGNGMCPFKLWFRANHKNWPQPANDFDFAGWQIAHTQLLRQMINESTAPELLIEGQGSFFTVHKGVSISGKPDLVEIDHESGSVLVKDAKTGKPSSTHEAQIQLYMWFLPSKFPYMRRMKFSGELVYRDYPNKTVGFPERKTFETALTAAVGLVSFPSAPRAIPSEQECNWCNITSEDCESRIE